MPALHKMRRAGIFVGLHRTMRGIAASSQKTFGSTGKQYVNRRCRNADYQGETGLQQTL